MMNLKIVKVKSNLLIIIIKTQLAEILGILTSYVN